LASTDNLRLNQNNQETEYTQKQINAAQKVA